MPKFSVLMSVYVNIKLSHFIECLDSIKEQSLLPSEVILVKDGNLDFNIYDVISPYDTLQISIVENELNIGLPKSLNKGLKYCNHEIVFRMDSDDVCYKNRFEIQYNKFIQNDKLAVLGANVELIDENSNAIVNVRNVPILDSEIRRIMAYKNPFNHPSVVFKKSIVLSVGGFTDLYLYEDWYLWFKLSRIKGVEFENCTEKLLKYRIRTFEDRKGIKIIKAEYNFYAELFKNKYIKWNVLFINVTAKFCIRLMPSLMYKFFKHRFDKIR